MRWIFAVLLLAIAVGVLRANSLDSVNSVSDLLSIAVSTASDSSFREYSLQRPYDPLLDADPVDLIIHHGYPGERHWATTEDGYIIGLHRIPRGRSDFNESPRPAVILAHPLLGCSAEWLVLGPGKALAYLLADEGFDVWLFNARGNTYSRNHTTLSPKDKAFWDYSFHEHGLYDVPATIEYVLNTTRQSKLQYVGFSMGTVAMFTMGSLRPEMSSRLRLVTALGPVTVLKHARSTMMRTFVGALPYFQRPANFLNLLEFLPHTSAMKWLAETFCRDGRPTQMVCQKLIDVLSGANPKEANATLLPYIVARTPAGTSYKNMLHLEQTLKLDFRQYDYGKNENLRRYGSSLPPQYNLKGLTAPVRLYYGYNDLLADYTDAEKICQTLPNVLSCKAMDDPLWTHLDFVWGNHVHKILYPKIIADMKAANAGVFDVANKLN